MQKEKNMNKEQIRLNFINACRGNLFEEVDSILTSYLKENDNFSCVVFDQAFINCVLDENIKAMQYLISNTTLKVSPMSYSYLFDKADEKPELIKFLCFNLPDVQELQNICDFHIHKSNDFMNECLKSRIEKDLFSMVLEQKERSAVKFKI